MALLIDSEDESVLLFRPDGQPTALRGADQLDLAPALPGFILAARNLFAALRPP